MLCVVRSREEKRKKQKSISPYDSIGTVGGKTAAVNEKPRDQWERALHTKTEGVIDLLCEGLRGKETESCNSERRALHPAARSSRTESRLVPAVRQRGSPKRPVTPRATPHSHKCPFSALPRAFSVNTLCTDIWLSNVGLIRCYVW